jgi:hypothetical protein
MNTSTPPRRHKPVLLSWMLLALACLIVLPVLFGGDWFGTPSASASARLGSDQPGGSVGDALDDTATESGQVAERLTPSPAEAPIASGPGEERFAPISSPESRTVSSDDGVPTALLARVGALRVYQVTAAPISVGFHEAATSRALPMLPFGRLLTNRNASRYEPTGDTVAGWPYAVMHSRGRSAHPTSAVDIAMRDDEPVLAPVSGEVVSVRSILVEGRHPDLRIEIQPAAAPELRVVVIHVDGVRVQPGDEVAAGHTRLADTARRFSFFSQIDELTAPERWPHVHLEVQPEPPPEPPPELPGPLEEDGPATD